jgi:hypothetical protein
MWFSIITATGGMQAQLERACTRQSMQQAIAQVAEGYRAMAERRPITALLRVCGRRR